MSPQVEDFIEQCGGFTKKIEGEDCTVIPNMDSFIDMLMLDVIYSMKGRKSIGGSIEDLRTEVHINDVIRRYGVSNYALSLGPFFSPGTKKVSLGKKLNKKSDNTL